MQNPATYAGTVLPRDGRNLDAYDRYQQEMLNLTERKRQQQALEKAKLDKNLIPPDVDMDSLFPGDADEVMQKLAEYQEAGLKYAEQGIDWMRDPKGVRERSQLEGEIWDLVLQSQQDKALAGNIITKSAEQGFDQDFDRGATLDRYANWKIAGDTGGIAGRKKFLEENGALLVEKPWDVNAFLTDFTKDIVPDKLVKEEVTKPGISGLRTLTRTYEMSPEQMMGRTQVMLQNKNYHAYTKALYDGLPPAQKAIIDSKAQALGYTDPLQYYADQDLKRMVQPKIEREDHKIALGGYSSSKTGSGKDDAYDQTMWLVSKLAAARGGDTETLTPVYINGKEYYSLDLAQYKFDQFTEYVPAVYENGIQVSPAAQKRVDEYIEELVFDPETGSWFAYTNKTIGQKITKGNAPKPYGYEMNDQQWSKLLRGIVFNNATTNKWTEKQLTAILDELKALDAQTGDINWDVIFPRQIQPTNTLPKKTKVNNGSTSGNPRSSIMQKAGVNQSGAQDNFDELYD